MKTELTYPNIRFGTIWTSDNGTRIVVLNVVRLPSLKQWGIVYATISLENRTMRPHACRVEMGFTETFSPSGYFRKRYGQIVADEGFVEDVL